MEKIAGNKSNGGWQNVYKHASAACSCDMVFAVYLPPQAEREKVPVLWYLSGLTCTHENAMTKANLQYFAARYGLAIVYPDTSPRGEGVADDEAYDLGQGAGFYVNATQEPWAPHFHMYDYVVNELPELLASEFSDKLDPGRSGITGHSMGGHGAITLALNNPDKFHSLSAFAPIANPTGSDWGKKQFTAYLGDDESLWRNHDSSILVQEKGWKSDMLIDQGLDDQFYELLRPQALADAMTTRKQAGHFRLLDGYDHSYFFIASFAEDHVKWHAERL